MGAEDFSYYVNPLYGNIPGCFVRFGCMPEGVKDRKSIASAHSARFVVNEKVFGLGSRFLANVAIEAAEYFNETKVL